MESNDEVSTEAGASFCSGRAGRDTGAAHTPGPREVGSHLTDVEVAGRVRMLMRYDLDHEAVCVMGRDRIMSLSNEVKRLNAINADLLAARAALEEVAQAARKADEIADGLRELISQSFQAVGEKDPHPYRTMHNLVFRLLEPLTTAKHALAKIPTSRARAD